MDVESNPGPTHNELSMFSWNIRSLRNKLDFLNDICSDFDIICLTETHLDETILSADLLIEGFSEPLRRDRNCFGVGVIVYLAESIYGKRRLDLE